MRFRSISLCCSSISSRTTWARFSAPTMSAYEVFFDARMFPPTKRCVMMWGLSRPESSVWMWYIFSLCLMLWLKPTTIFFTSTAIAPRLYRISGRAARSRPSAATPRSDIDVLGREDRPAEEAPRHRQEPLRRVRHEEAVLRLPLRPPEPGEDVGRDRARAVHQGDPGQLRRDGRREQWVVRAAEHDGVDARLAERREV